MPLGCPDSSDISTIQLLHLRFGKHPGKGERSEEPEEQEGCCETVLLNYNSEATLTKSQQQDSNKTRTIPVLVDIPATDREALKGPLLDEELQKIKDG